MEKVLSFVIYFVLIYLFYFFTVIIRKNKYEKYMQSKQIVYFIKKYNLDFNKISFNKFINIIAIVNSLIMAITIMILEYIPHLMLKLLVAFVILIILILLSYKLIGIWIERRNKNV